MAGLVDYSKTLVSVSITVKYNDKVDVLRYITTSREYFFTNVDLVSSFIAVRLDTTDFCINSISFTDVEVI